jgi:LPS export ABC transporter protein LptC
MAVRIEYILSLAFVILVASMVGFTPESHKATSSKGEKEVSFENFALNIVKEKDEVEKLKAVKAIKYRNYIDFKDVNFTNEMGDTVLSKDGRYKQDLLHMYNNVHLSRDDGVNFYTDALNYDLKVKEIETEKPFLLDYNLSQVNGKKLTVFLNSKVISAYHVNAHIWFVGDENRTTSK